MSVILEDADESLSFDDVPSHLKFINHKAHEKIAQQVEEYLSRGGAVQTIPFGVLTWTENTGTQVMRDFRRVAKNGNKATQQAMRAKRLKA